MLKVSIITPTLNNQTTIEDTLKSVKNQNYPNIEHIIIDGNSQDDTISIIKQYQHVTVLISEQDKGIYDALNKGLAVATGDIIGILNADDFYTDSEVIAKIAELFQKEKTNTLFADLVYTAKADSSKIVRYWKTGCFSLSKIYNGWAPPHPTFFVRREIYERLGYYNPSFKIAGDYEMMLRLLLKNRVSTYYLPKNEDWRTKFRQPKKSPESQSRR